MENLKISTKNPFDESYEDFTHSKRAQQLNEKFKDRTFDQRTQKIAIGLHGFTFVLNAFSATTASLFIYSFLFDSLQNAIAATGFTITLLFLIEMGKRDQLPEIFKAIFKYKKLDFAPTLLVLGLMSISVFSSFEGAKLLPKTMTAGPTLVNKDSVTTHYQNLIAAKDIEINDYFETTNYKNKLSRDARITYNQLKEQKGGLEKRYYSAIDKVDADNESIEIAHSEEMESTGVNIGYAALISEGLLILIFLFLNYRDYRAIATFAVVEASAPSYSPMSPLDLSSVSPSLPIGFHNRKTGDTDTNDTPINLVSTGDTGATQTQMTQVNTNIRTQTQKQGRGLKYRTIIHNDKPYKMADVKRFIKTYSDRYNESLAKGDLVTAAKRKEKLDYWKSRLSEF